MTVYALKYKGGNIIHERLIVPGDVVSWVSDKSETERDWHMNLFLVVAVYGESFVCINIGHDQQLRHEAFFSRNAPPNVAVMRRYLRGIAT